MAAYDIYIGTKNEEATAHGPEFVQDGMNPADALAKFVCDERAFAEIRSQHPDFTDLYAFDDDMGASVYQLDDGAWELHVYVDDTDTAITMPPTDYMSATEASDALGVSRMRINQLVNSGQLNGRMVGNAWIVARGSVENRMNQTKIRG